MASDQPRQAADHLRRSLCLPLVLRRRPAPQDEQHEAAERAPHHDRCNRERERPGHAQQETPTQQRTPRAHSARHRLRALGAPAHFTGGQHVRIHRPVRLIGDEVEEKEQGGHQRHQPEPAHEPDHRHRDRPGTCSRKHERQATADPGSQRVRPGPEDQRDPERHHALAADDRSDHRGLVGVPARHLTQLSRDDCDREGERERRQRQQGQVDPLAVLERPLLMLTALLAMNSATR